MTASLRKANEVFNFADEEIATKTWQAVESVPKLGVEVTLESPHWPA
jgi:hypothetical protein